MLVEFKDWKESPLQEYLGLYHHTAKQAVERMATIKASSPDSIDYKVNLELLTGTIVPKLEEMGATIYSFTISYHADPQAFPSYNQKDTLDAQLALDDVAALLREAGITVNFTR